MTPLSIVIVNWNTCDLLRECLRSLAATGVDCDAIVVDNASDDASVAMVHDRFPQVRLVENRENVGFSRAVNQVLAGTRSRHVLLLNPDAVVSPGSLQTMLAFMGAHPRCGVLGPKVVHPRGRMKALSAGRQPSLRSATNHFLFISRFSRKHDFLLGMHLIRGVHDDRPRLVDWVSGACLLVRREVIDEVGPLTERWFMYAEDMEWCARIAAAGWEIWHLPAATVTHHGGASLALRAGISTLWLQSLRNHYHTLQRPTAPQRLLFDAILVVGLTIRSLGYRARAMLDPSRRTLWRGEARKFAVYARFMRSRIAAG